MFPADRLCRNSKHRETLKPAARPVCFTLQRTPTILAALPAPDIIIAAAIIKR